MNLGVKWDLCVLFVQTAKKCQDQYTKVYLILKYILTLLTDFDLENILSLFKRLWSNELTCSVHVRFIKT